MDEKKSTVLPFKPRQVLPPLTDETHALVSKLMDVLAAEDPGDGVAVQALAMIIGKVASDHPDPVTVIGAAAFQSVFQVLGEAGVLNKEVLLGLVHTSKEPESES